MKQFFIFALPLTLLHSDVSALKSPESNRIYVKPVFSLPLTLDPILMNDTASQVVANQIYDGLLRVSENLVLEPAIAKSWATSKDGLRITFLLRTNARFHDGKIIEASDVVFSLARAMNSPIVAKLYEYIARDTHGTPKIAASDQHTVTIELKKPFPPILSVLAGVTAKILPMKLVRAHSRFFDAPVGSGPFKFQKRNDSVREITLAANEVYYTGAPQLQQILLKESSLPQAVTLAKTGAAHEVVTPPLPANHEVFNFGQRLTSPVVATWVIGLNTRIPPLDQIAVRRSLKIALETDRFREEFYPDSIQSFGYIPPGLPGYLRKKTILGQPASASYLNRLPAIFIDIPDSLEGASQMGAHLERAAAVSGIKIKVTPKPWDEIMEAYTSHKSAAFLVSMGVDYPDAAFLLQNAESTNPDNFSGLNDPVLDRFIIASRSTQDRVKRDRLHLAAVNRLESLAVTVNLFHPKQNLWVHKCVHGVKPHLMGDVYLDYRRVHVDEDCMSMKVAHR